MSEYPIWKNYEIAAGQDLTNDLLNQAWKAAQESGREPYREIVSSEEFTRRTGIPVHTVDYVPPGFVYVLNRDYLWTPPLGDWEWHDADGSVLKPHNDRYEATLYRYHELSFTRRNSSARLTRIRSMSAFQKFIARAKVIFTAAPTYLVAASAIVIIVSSEAATVLPAGVATTVGAVALKIVAVLTAAINIIRRVTPVLPSERGIL